MNVSGHVSANDLSRTVLQFIEDLSIGDKLVGQSYDGAATLSGRKKMECKSRFAAFTLKPFIFTVGRIS